MMVTLLWHYYQTLKIEICSFMVNVIAMLNKNTLGVKKCEANQKPLWLYKRPKTLISNKAKKLNILLRILSLALFPYFL